VAVLVTRYIFGVFDEHHDIGGEEQASAEEEAAEEVQMEQEVVADMVAEQAKQ
jgi:hypothetical protein